MSLDQGEVALLQQMAGVIQALPTMLMADKLDLPIADEHPPARPNGAR